MRKPSMTAVFVFLVALGSTPAGPAMSFAQAEAERAAGTGNITVEDATNCTTTVNTIQCNGKRCTYSDKIWWQVQNDHNQNARVAVVNLKHQDSGLYVDPLQGPGNKSEHVVEVNGNGGTETLKTKVRKQNGEYFAGLYDYKVAVSFYDGTSWGSWTVCLDPMIDIDA